MTVPKGAIKKSNLTFTAMFLWVLVRHYFSPTAADNIVTWDRAVLMASMIVGFKVDFVWPLQVVTHKRAFKVTTTYPFPCMIFSLCGSAGVPIWHRDQLKTPRGTINIGLIRDEANELSPCRGSRPEIPPIADDLVDTVAHARTATDTASNDTTRTTPLRALVPLGRVQKLEAQIATLLHKIQPWMQKTITESEKRLERKIVHFTEWKIAEVNQRLDTFDLRVLARPTTLVDVLTLKAAVDSIRADTDTILEARVLESEPLSVEPAEDTMLAVLVATSENPPPPPRESAKRHKGRVEDEARARKKEHREMEAARRASVAEEAAHQIRASELAAGASSSRTVEIAGSTTDGTIVTEDTTEGVQIAKDLESGEPDPPTY